ncbi:hypothetical protein T01_4668 [Trichinella spiralis]|uniref:Uncharacterized protein n=1 Tax=Trichinella spiralis TaxID=6334 RepID=A0A0V1AJL0_TRISP|nr:hypothetical protein T01_4668 [Trichinella spiralis]
MWVKEADGCAILKRVAMRKAELRRTTDMTEKAPTMEESVGQKKLCH